MYEVIVKAITERRLIRLIYEPGARIAEPCAFGENQHGHNLLRAFQRAGASASGEHIHWKLFRVDRIRRIELLDERFLGARPEYRRNDRAMNRRIFCQL
jgi:predicted DNA-binding transcriptional regulator YafY